MNTPATPNSRDLHAVGSPTCQPFQGCPQLLLELPADQKAQISASLANDENSSDEELTDFWTQECGIAADAAKVAISFRSHFFEDPFFELFPET